VYHHPGDVKDPPHHPVDGSQGIIKGANLWADPPRVTPANENGVDDLTTIRASISVGRWPGSFAAHEVSLTYDVQVWRADGCSLVRTLSGSLPVNGEDIVVGIEATWDGRDEGGHWAPSGTYYYSVRVLLERAHGGNVTLLDTLQTQVQALEVINNDRWERVSIVNMDDSDRKLDLVCVRTEESLLDVTFQAFAAGTLLGESTYGPQQASIVKEAGNYTEVCFSDVPAPAQSGPDSGLDLVVLINVAPAGPLAPVSIRPPPPDAAPVPTVRTVPLAADLPIDPAVAIGRPPSDPVNNERLYLVVKTSLGAAPPQGQDWTDVLYLMEHVSGRIWRTPDFVPISVWHYKSPPPLNEVITRTLAPRHNVALAYAPNDHTIPTYSGDVDLTQGGRLYLAYGKPQPSTVPEQINHLHIALSHPNDFFVWTGHAPLGPLKSPIASFESSSEPGNRVGVSLLAEPGKDANPRLAAKVAPEFGMYRLAVSPYCDGIREWRLRDSNDWWVMRDGICRELVRYRCDTNDCERDPADVESTCGPVGPYPSGFPLPVFDTDGESCDLSD